MTVADFLLPVFMQILLTFILLVMMLRECVSSILMGEVEMGDIALGEPNWTKRGLQVGNAYHNQLELPVLFYVLTAFILITRAGDTLLLVLAWVFALSRLVHAYIHATSNVVDHRFKAYAAGLATLILMWGVFAAKILTGA